MATQANNKAEEADIKAAEEQAKKQAEEAAEEQAKKLKAKKISKVEELTDAKKKFKVTATNEQILHLAKLIEAATKEQEFEAYRKQLNANALIVPKNMGTKVKK